MRGLLLLITTIVLLYIAYYLDHYTSLFHSRPKAKIVTIATPTSTPTVLADPVALKARALNAESEPDSLPRLGDRYQRLIESLQANDLAALEIALSAILEVEPFEPPLSESQRERLTSLVIANYSEDLATVLLAYFNDRAYRPATVDHAIKLALRLGNRECLRLVDDKLRSNEQAARDITVKALATLEPIWLNPTIAEALAPTLIEQLLQLETERENHLTALQKMVDYLADPEKENLQTQLNRFKPTPTVTPTPTAEESTE